MDLEEFEKRLLIIQKISIKHDISRLEYMTPLSLRHILIVISRNSQNSQTSTIAKSILDNTKFK